VAVRIYVDRPIGPLPQDIREVARRVRPADYIPAADLVILQYPIWFPLAERLRESPRAALFWYHGVTPPHLWSIDSERNILRRAEIGTELAWHAHLAITASPYAARELHAHSGYPEERIRVVPLGVDITSFRQRPPTPVLTALRSRWNLEAKRILLYTGRVVGNKRIDLLIEALARLVGAHPDVHLLVVGDNQSTVAHREVAARLLALAERLGVASHVTFTGRVDAIEPYYHLADVYLLASQHECFGVPLIEAMAAGVPIVASASGSMPWVLDATGVECEAAGLVFSPGDVEGLVKQISRLLHEPQTRQALIERGYQRVEHFSKERFVTNASKVLAEVQELACQGAPPAAARPSTPLTQYADVALRNYRVRSHAPLLGRLIEWVRYNMTTHLKEAYLDRIVERQVLYNRTVADEIAQLQTEVAKLKDQVNELQEVGKPPMDQSERRDVML
jgi:glycosyltransferase involved in cell wall biosynthesis